MSPHQGGRRIYAYGRPATLHSGLTKARRFDGEDGAACRQPFGNFPWNFGSYFHTTFAELANAFIKLGRFDEAVAAARKSLRKSQT
jgi:hypothetical protein